MSIPAINTYALPQAQDLPSNRVRWQVQPPRAALLIHDMQYYFLRFYGSNNPLVDQLIANIASLRAWAKANGMPVIYTAQPTEQQPQDRALLNDMWGPGLTTADPALQAVTAALAPEADDIVLTKWRYSAFQRSPLQQQMRDWGRDQLVIVGVYAHIGCLTTALDAFMRDIQPFMVADAVADFSEDEHRMALRYVAGRCGAVVTTAQLSKPATSAFDLAWLKGQIVPLLEEAPDELDGDDNLMDYGLDSAQVMKLIARWEGEGLKLRFEELAQTPSLKAWQRLIERKSEQKSPA